jgi:iron complex outermembrane receptor protein
MFTNNFVTRVGYSFVAICALLSSQFVSGQALEEIIVTAQKREQSLQDVPISVSTIAGDTILENNLNRLEDLAATVPGLFLNETRNGVSIFIRGIGSSDANNSFEQSSAQFSNGLYVGRARSSLVSFMDIDRVEVLKGPQPTYFGNNAIGGGINIHSRKPTTEWEGYVNASHGFEFEDSVVDIAYGGPITDTFRVRLAGRWSDLEGWGKDNISGATTNGREGLAYRGSAQWQPIEPLIIDVAYEHLNMDQGIFLFEGVGCATTGLCDTLPAGTADEFVFNQAGNHCGTTPVTQSGRFPAADLTTRPDLFPCGRRAVDHDQGRVQISYTFDNGVELTNLSGVYTDNFVRFEDIDKTSFAGFQVKLEEVYVNRSNEIRFTSPGGETIDWMVGHYWLDSTDKQFTKLKVSTNAPFQFNMNAAVGNSRFSGNRFEEENTTWSVFGAATWNVTDDVSFDFGARYTDVEKSGYRVEQNSKFDPMNMISTIIPVPADPAAGIPDLVNDAECLGTETVTTSCAFAVFEDTDVSYNVGINYQVPTLDAMVYAKHTTGYKAGGHPNAGVDLDDGLLSSFQFQAETANAFEIGTKSTWLDGTLEVNLALWHNTISGLQQSVLDPLKTAANAGNPINVISNVGGAVSKGVELNGRWATTDTLTMTYFIQYIDAAYTDYPGAQCNQYELLTELCDVNGVRDRDGLNLEYTADVEATVGANWLTPSVADGMDLTLGGNLYYNSGYNASTLFIPDLQQGEYIRLDLRATLASQNDTWSFSAFGNNVTDKIVKTKVNPSARNGPNDAWEVVSQRGAEYGVQFRYNFGALTDSIF